MRGRKLAAHETRILFFSFSLTILLTPSRAVYQLKYFYSLDRACIKRGFRVSANIISGPEATTAVC